MSVDRHQDAEDCKVKGNEYLQKGDFDMAIKYYTQAIEFNDKNHVYYSNRSAAYLSKGFADSALKDADHCIALNPQWPKGYGRKGAALHKLKEFKKAVDAYQEGLKYAPSDASLMEGLEQVQNDMNGPTTPGAFGDDSNPFGQIFGPDMMDRIRASPKLSKYLSDPSYVQTMQSIQANPKSLNMFLGDSRVLETLSEFIGINMTGAPPGEDEASERPKPSASSGSSKKEEEKKKPETEEEKAARELREKGDVFKNKGNEHYRKKEFDEAIKCYEEALQVIPGDMTYMLNIASVKLEQGDLESCVKQCLDAIESGRTHQASFSLIAKAYERIGNAYARHDKNEDAITYYRKAQVESHNPALDQTIKKIEKKIKENQERAYIDPAKGTEAKERGNELFKKGQYPEAIKEYSEAIKRDPTNAVYHSNRAAAYIKLMDWGRAKEDCNKAIELDPKLVRAYVRRGTIETAIKEYKKAMESFRKGLELDPDNEECREGLNKVSNAIRNSDDYDNKERQARAMEDPEIRGIMQDPVMIQVLRDMSTDPRAAAKHMSDPNIASKIEKLIAAGIVSTR